MKQIEKNTVKADHQLKECDYLSFLNPDGKGKRILVAGNSICLHGRLDEIGWFGNWGMAASCPEKDFVHLLHKAVYEVSPDAVLCIVHVSSWESHYHSGETYLEKIKAVQAFEPDVLIMRAVENCPGENLDRELFYKQYARLVEFLDPENRAKRIITTSFWHHLLDPQIRAYAEEKGYPLVELGDLGEEDEMKAIGLFEHSGVANHPGDRGMELIAKRVFDAVKQSLSL